MINRIDIMMFISSIHAILSELDKVKDVVSPKVYAELKAMEVVLKRDYLDKNKK